MHHVHPVGSELRESYPNVHWLQSYAVLGPYDLVNIFEALSEEVASKVALMIRSRARVVTETDAGLPWESILATVDQLAGGQSIRRSRPIRRAHLK